ncbi:urea transport system permease protein [Oceanicella actignis]|uniref:Urea transport system permease protein n=1 Tax=Oceanicella actignis TaxID=1189325 RepID=A0A1M7TTP8_9RHOB|nr:amino acid/amide ABC transporter membrane protein 1, HAAT family (TC 3.A.1.4.-) [Oceanicella actignis]SHN74107.1 urea transport system permease protein [Oceanicella actignis]
MKNVLALPLRPYLAALLTALALMMPSASRAAGFEELVARLPEGGYSDRAQTIDAIARTGDPRAAQLFEALLEGRLHARKADGRVVIVVEGAAGATAIDALSGESLGEAPARSTERIKVNNRLRGMLRSAIGALSLTSPDRETRLRAAQSVLKSGDPADIEALDAALSAESDREVAAALAEARAAAILNAKAPVAERRAAVAILAARGDAAAQAALAPHASDPAIGAEVAAALARIERTQRMWGVAQNVWYGLSLGSVLMLAAIGLAITFGVMGVINMAHGELVMLGAYTTFAVQEAIRGSAPWLLDFSLLIAAPLAMLVAGGVGIAIERGIVRHLYGRPLETLLATWGVSLILQQAVRTIFGPNNREVGNPSWMSGAFEIGQMTVTWSRLWILIFALAVFFALLLVLRRSFFGLQMRAVTQDRPMAAEMGIDTGRVDALTFGLGAGIAGLAGVALSQIDNVSPNLGQSYIVDSFMVVVFGGAGNLWGALAGGFGLGVVNKFLEPWTGAVLGKILVLAFIILFIQKRPRGLFAQRGRAAEA